MVLARPSHPWARRALGVAEQGRSGGPWPSSGALGRRIARIASARADALPPASGFRPLEHGRLELVAFEELVELGAVALREARGFRDVPAGDPQEGDQAVA